MKDFNPRPPRRDAGGFEMNQIEKLGWLADKIPAFGDYGKDCANEMRKAAEKIKALEDIISRQQFIEDRYEELMLSARRCWRYYGADQELFDASIKTMDFLIRRHATEIDEMDISE